MSESVPEEIRWRVERAEGYLLLHMVKAARAELEALAAPTHALGVVREAWLQQAMAEKDWPKAAVLAEQLRVKNPARAEFWVWEAYSRRRAEGVAAARTILEEALKLFPAVALIPYNLACYACSEGELDAARRLLATVLTRTPDLAAIAAEDEDLRPLWDELESLAHGG